MPFGFGGEGDMTTMILQWVFFIFIFLVIFPKLYFYQMFAKVESSARKLEELSRKGQKLVIEKTGKFGRERKELKERLDRFIEFFMIPPVSLDPFGIMKKLEHVVDNTEDRFKIEAREMAPKANEEEVMNFFMGLQAEVSIHTIAKIVRHYVELVKEFKNLQIAMILQMQLPLIMKLVKAEYRGLNAFLKGTAIGDGIAPLVISSMLSKPGKEIAPDVLASTEERWGREITFIKAKGPGGRLGKLGKAVQEICKKHRIAKIITVDAAQKLEGEKTGTVSEGIGVAIGGMGIQKAKIEEIAVKNDIPIDAIAIKMSPFEAISPMPEEVINAMGDTKKLLRERIEQTKKGSHIIVVAVGNTCGIDNMNKELKKIIEKLRKEAKKSKEEQELEKKKGWFLKKKGGKSGSQALDILASYMGFLYR